MFTGFSGSYTFLIKRFGIAFNTNYYLPKTYYGKVTFLNLNVIEDQSIPVYAKGSAFTVGAGMDYDMARTKSGKFKITGSTGFTYFEHSATFDKEPFKRIYGYAYNISVNFFSFYAGLALLYKIGYVPVHLSLKKAFSIDKQEYNDFKVPGFYELNIGVTFPILKSPPPTEIKKIYVE